MAVFARVVVREELGRQSWRWRAIALAERPAMAVERRGAVVEVGCGGLPSPLEGGRGVGGGVASAVCEVLFLRLLPLS